MKKPLLLGLALAALLAPLLSASQEQLAASIQQTRTEALGVAEQLRATLSAVNDLTKQREGDLRPAFDAFALQIPKAESAAAWTRTRVKWMDSDGARYFDNWQKTINTIGNTSLRKTAQKRLDSVRKSYDKVQASLASASEKFTPFLGDLADLKKALANDVTAGGVKAVRGVVNSANSRFNGVNSAISDASKELEKMAAALSSEKQ